METRIDAVLVLAGGEGRRLGGPKAWLDWSGEPLLGRVVRRLSPLSDRVVVAARSGQRLPDGPWERVDDAIADAGPLAGVAAGLTALSGPGAALRAAVCACDADFQCRCVLTGGPRTG